MALKPEAYAKKEKKFGIDRDLAEFEARVDEKRARAKDEDEKKQGEWARLGRKELRLKKCHVFDLLEAFTKDDEDYIVMSRKFFDVFALVLEDVYLTLREGGFPPISLDVMICGHLAAMLRAKRSSEVISVMHKVLRVIMDFETKRKDGGFDEESLKNAMREGATVEGAGK